MKCDPTNGIGLLRNSKVSDTSADSFIPLLIYVVLQANPEHLVSNIQYILRFRNQDRLVGEAGYYISSLVRLYAGYTYLDDLCWADGSYTIH